MILAVTMNPAVDKIYFVNGFNIDEVHRPNKMIASAGGKGLNVARVAYQVGSEVAVTGFLGGGNGSYLRKKIKELGLIDRFVEIEDETRICVNVTDLDNKTCTEVLEAGPTITKEQANHFLIDFESMLDDVDIVTLSGSLPKGLDSDFYGQLINVCHKNNTPVLLDTGGLAFKDGAKENPYVVKPNEVEIKAVYDGDVSSVDGLSEAIRFFKKQGIKLPIVSLGADGSLAGLKDGIYKVSFPKIETINTVGSGDSFIAGLAVGLSKGMGQIDTLKMATACGSANTQYDQTGFVEEALVKEYISKVNVEKIADY